MKVRSSRVSTPSISSLYDSSQVLLCPSSQPRFSPYSPSHACYSRNIQQPYPSPTTDTSLALSSSGVAKAGLGGEAGAPSMVDSSNGFTIGDEEDEELSGGLEGGLE